MGRKFSDATLLVSVALARGNEVVVKVLNISIGPTSDLRIGLR